MKNNKILIAHSSNDSYGASKIFVQLLELLKNNNYELFVILPENGYLDEYLKKINVKTYYFNLGVFRKKYLNFFGIINRLYKIIRSIFFLKNLINKNKIDLVYTNTSVIWSSGIAAKLCGVRSIYHLHEIPYGFYLYEALSKIVINFISCQIVCVSNSVLDHWKNSCNKSKIMRVYNGVPILKGIEKKKLIGREIVLTNISRISPYKGHMYLFKIAKNLIKNDIEFKIQIIGDCGPGYQNYERTLRQFVKKNKLDRHIVFLGFKSNISHFINTSNFLIHTPIKPDPLPTVIFESLLSKTPVISTNLGGAKEILDNGNCGLLIPHDDHKKSTKLIINFINDYVLQKKHVENFKDLYEKKFSVKLFNKHIIKLIKKTNV